MNYRIDKKRAGPSGTHIIHTEACRKYERLSAYVWLGPHPNVQSAQLGARVLGYVDTVGCEECCAGERQTDPKSRASDTA